MGEGTGGGTGLEVDDLDGIGVGGEGGVFGDKEGEMGKRRELGKGSSSPLTSLFLHPQRVQSLPGQARPVARGGRRAGEGRSALYPPPSVPEQPHPPEP